jgi:lipoate-protein ligase A
VSWTSAGVSPKGDAPAVPAAGVPVRLRWIVDLEPRPGAWNMAIDMALAEAVAAGAPAAVRWYRWRPACLSLGRHQRAEGRYDPERLRRLGLDAVRRPTGGGAVLHDDELTYAVAVPARLWGGPRNTFAAVHAALEAGLRAFGVPVVRAPGRRRGAVPEACFAEPAPGELLLEGRKLVGSAQARVGGALLQHGSILLTGDQRLASPGDRPAAGAGLAGWLGRRPEPDELLRALAFGFRDALGAELAPAPLDPETLDGARRWHPRFGDPAWTWRR